MGNLFASKELHVFKRFIHFFSFIFSQSKEEVKITLDYF